MTDEPSGMTGLEKKLNKRVRLATWALDIYHREAMAGVPPTDRELCGTVDKVLEWISWYAHLDYPYRCLFNRALLSQASPDILSDADVSQAKPIAQKVAIEAAYSALVGRPRTRRRTSSLAEHVKSEMRKAWRLLLDGYGIPTSWRPATEPEASDDAPPATELADYHSNADDTETYRVKGGSPDIENLAGHDEDETPMPVAPRTWVSGLHDSEQQALARRFRSAMEKASDDAVATAEEWTLRNLEQDRAAGQRLTPDLRRDRAELPREWPEARWSSSRDDFDWLWQDSEIVEKVAFESRAANVLRGITSLAVDDHRVELVAKEILNEVDFEIWSRRDGGYGSGEAHRVELAAAGVDLSAANYRQRRLQAIRRVDAAVEAETKPT
jgi:hypothetical protein